MKPRAVSGSDEARGSRHEPKGTGSALLLAALTRENLQRAWKRVRANKGVAGVDGLDIDQTAAQLRTGVACDPRTTVVGDVPAQSGTTGDDPQARAEASASLASRR